MMTKRPLLMLLLLLIATGIKAQSMGEIFPDDYYFDALDENYQNKKGLGLKTYAVVNQKGLGLSPNELVLDAMKDSYHHKYIDRRREKVHVEFEDDKFYKEIKYKDDTLYRDEGSYNSGQAEDYYVLIPYKKYIVNYKFTEDGKIELLHVYMNELTRANEFKDKDLVIDLVEKLEQKVKAQIDELRESTIKEKTAELDNRELPKAELKSSSLEAKLLKAIQEFGENQGWKETFTKVVITSDWWYNKNKYSGRITGKTIEIAAVATWPNGKCTYQMFNMHREATDNLGKTFGKIYRSGTGSQYDIRCDKVK